MSLYSPPDVDAAHDAFGANCGPCALAALLRRPVMAVRDAFPWYPSKPWCSPIQLVGALAALRTRGVSRRHDPGDHTFRDGLAYVQWTGPWTAPGASPRWAYRHTHWIAVACSGELVYDANLGSWLHSDEWAEDIAPQLIRDVKRADGGWWIRTTVEVHQ